MKPEKICDRDFQSYNLLLTWAHEQYFRICQKTKRLANKFAVPARGFKRQGKNNGRLGRNKNLGSRKPSLRVKQNIYSPNRLYITFPMLVPEILLKFC